MCAVAALALILGTRPATAQLPPADFASPFLPADHWAAAVAVRLDALGLAAPGFPWGDRSLTRREAGWILRQAAFAAEEDWHDLLPLLRDYYQRFKEEFPTTARALENPVSTLTPQLGDGWALLGYEVQQGLLEPGSGYYSGLDRIAPKVRDDVSAPAGGVVLAGGLFPYLAVDALPIRGGSGEWGMDAGYTSVVWRDIGLWAGRRRSGFGFAHGGSIVLNPSVPLDGGGVYLADPVHLPWIFRGLGPLRFHTFLSRLDGRGGIEDPWFWAMRASIQPHPRLDLGVSRALMFGGTGNEPVTLVNLLSVLVGKHGSGGSTFDNQIFALDGRYRFPVGPMPVLDYFEWGIEDSAGAWFDVPGIIAGVETPMIPGIPELGAGVEYVSFAPSCCGNPIWYRHWKFLDGWTQDGALLGHPLGGHGREASTFVYADLIDARIRFSGRLFLRQRGEENLFAPDREGLSYGGSMKAELQVMQRLYIVLDGWREIGDGWDARDVFVGGRFLF